MVDSDFPNGKEHDCRKWELFVPKNQGAKEIAEEIKTYIYQSYQEEEFRTDTHVAKFYFDFNDTKKYGIYSPELLISLDRVDGNLEDYKVVFADDGTPSLLR